MTDVLSAIDSTLTSHETGNPWPDRVPSLDEVVEVLFGPETGQPLPACLGATVLVPAPIRAPKPSGAVREPTFTRAPRRWWRR